MLINCYNGRVFYISHIFSMKLWREAELDNMATSMFINLLPSRPFMIMSRDVILVMGNGQH